LRQRIPLCLFLTVNLGRAKMSSSYRIRVSDVVLARFDRPHCGEDSPRNLHLIQIFRESELSMTHVVAEPCFNCKYTDCVTVCPVECFYEGEAMLFIHPEECIDCEACVPECPPAAIFHQDNLPAEWSDYTALNAEMAVNCPVITERKDPMGPPIEGH
jgi:ferredoxin